MEDETATWSSNGKTYKTMNLGLWSKKNRPINCDVLFLLRIFARLTNIGVATVHLPASLKDCKSLQDYARGVQNSMTNTHPLDQKIVEDDYELLSSEIKEAQRRLRRERERKVFDESFGGFMD